MRPSSPTESVVTVERREKLKGKVVDKLYKEYAKLGNREMGPTGKAILQSEADYMIKMGLLKTADIRRAAIKIRDAQRTEAGMTPKRGALPSADTASTNGRLRTPMRPVATPNGRQRPAWSSSVSLQREDDNLFGTLPGLGSGPMSTRSNRLVIHNNVENILSSGTLGPVASKRWSEKLRDKEWDDRVNNDIEAWMKETRDERLRELKAKLAQKETLDGQVEQTQHQRDLDQQAEEEFQRREAEALDQWKEASREEEEQRRENRAREMADLREQIELYHQAKQEQAEMAKMEEELYAQKVAEEYQRRKEEDRLKREKKIADIKAFMEYNEEVAEMRKKKKEEEVEMDLDYMRQYKEHLDQQERAYQDNLKRVGDKVSKRSQHAMKSYFSSMWEMQQRDEERARREQEAKEARDRADEAARKERIRINNDETKTVLGQQIEAKEEVKRKEAAEAMRVRLRMEAEVRAEEEARIRRIQEDKRMRQERAKELEKQVAESEVKMSRPLEIKIGTRS